MNTSIGRVLGLGLWLAGATLASADIERTVERTFRVDGPGTLTVKTPGGVIRVRPGAEGAVTIKVRQRVRADSEPEADEVLRRLELALEQTGNNVRAAASYDGAKEGSWWRRLRQPVNVDFEVEVPAGFAADLVTSGGGITVGDVAGPVTARTSGGAIELGRIGGAVKARTSGGTIILKEAGGPVELSTSGGNIQAGPVRGSARLATAGGSIRIEAAAGALQASTSGGSIRAALHGALTDDCSLSTAGGSVKVTVERGLAFRLDASASGGGVELSEEDLNLAKANRSRGRVTGEANGGGRTLKLRSAGGSVSVRTE